MAYHLGPDVTAELDGTRAILQWAHGQASGAAWLELPKSLRWSLHKGETNPILGWYSSGLSHRVPVFTLLGHGRSTPAEPLSTQLEFLDVAATGKHPEDQ